MLEIVGQSDMMKRGGIKMDLDLRITDLAGASPEHSAVFVNFVAAVLFLVLFRDIFKQAVLPIGSLPALLFRFPIF